MHRPLVTVIIPMYNQERYVEKTMQSITAQNWDPLEILLIDDGSTDASCRVARNVLESSGRSFRVLRQENRGLSATRNRGIEEAHGDYLLFHDSDDFDEPDFIRSLVQRANNTRSDMAFCGYNEVGEGGETFLRYEEKFRYLPGVASGKDALVRYLRNDIWMFTGAILYRRAFLIDRHLRFRTGRWGAEDVEFIARALFEARGVTSVPRVLTYHLEHPGSLVTSSRSVFLRPGQMVSLFTALWRHFEEAPDIARIVRERHLSNALAELLAMLILAGRNDVFQHVLGKPEIRETLRTSLGLWRQKPKIALRAFELLYCPALFTRYYENKKRRLGIVDVPLPGRPPKTTHKESTA